MKTITCIVLSLVATSLALHADFFSPFADSKVGAAVTSDGEIVAVKRKGGGADYFVRCGTCTGPVDIPAQIRSKLLREDLAGRPASITATIKER
jgi:hypothetical protein